MNAISLYFCPDISVFPFLHSTRTADFDKNILDKKISKTFEFGTRFFHFFVPHFFVKSTVRVRASYFTGRPSSGAPGPGAPTPAVRCPFGG
jgi:hypothetical protein